MTQPAELSLTSNEVALLCRTLTGTADSIEKGYLLDDRIRELTVSQLRDINKLLLKIKALYGTGYRSPI